MCKREKCREEHLEKKDLDIREGTSEEVVSEERHEGRKQAM